MPIIYVCYVLLLHDVIVHDSTAVQLSVVQVEFLVLLHRHHLILLGEFASIHYVNEFTKSGLYTIVL